MKKHFMRLIAGSIFSLSTAAIAGVAALLVWAPPAFATRCPLGSCSVYTGCVGSACSCTYDQQTMAYYCAPPSQ